MKKGSKKKKKLYSKKKKMESFHINTGEKKDTKKKLLSYERWNLNLPALWSVVERVSYDKSCTYFEHKIFIRWIFSVDKESLLPP